MDIQQYMTSIGVQAREASRCIARANSQVKNDALNSLARAIGRNSTALLEANQRDLAAARSAGLEPAMIDRLTFGRAAEAIDDEAYTEPIKLATCAVIDSIQEINTRAGQITSEKVGD